MISLTFESKAFYEELMTAYLSGGLSAEDMVQSFFKRRHADVSRELRQPRSERHPQEDAWENLFAKLFNACDDLDMFPDDNDGQSSRWIDEPTFRQRISEILPEFQSFGPSSD